MKESPYNKVRNAVSAVIAGLVCVSMLTACSSSNLHGKH